MEKKICSYETLFVVSGNLADEAAKELTEKFVNLINENGTDVSVNEWGKRRLAYPINYVTEGYYVLATYKSESNFPAELDRVFNIDESIMRSMTVKLDFEPVATVKEEIVAEEVEKQIFKNHMFITAGLYFFK